MRPDASWLHRLGAGWKLATLMIAGAALLAVHDTIPLLAALVGVGLLYGAARIPTRLVRAQLRPAVLLLAVLFAAQALTDGWAAGLVAVLRVAVLVLLAALVSLTTPAAAMTRTLERGLGPLRRFGLRPRAVALALSLAVRLLPLLAERASQVRDAQRARGLDRTLLALAVPLLVQSLKMGHDLAEAIEARGFDADER